MIATHPGIPDGFPTMTNSDSPDTAHPSQPSHQRRNGQRIRYFLHRIHLLPQHGLVSGVIDYDPAQAPRHLANILTHRRNSTLPTTPELINHPGQTVIGRVLTRRNRTADAVSAICCAVAFNAP